MCRCVHLCMRMCASACTLCASVHLLCLPMSLYGCVIMSFACMYVYVCECVCRCLCTCVPTSGSPVI